MMRNFSYTIPDGEHAGKTVWSGRYCCVCGIVLRKFTLGGTYTWHVLANRRSENCPDFQGYWNLPCGYLEADEDAAHGCAREVFEETSYFTFPQNYKFLNVETDPYLCNHGNVTIFLYNIDTLGYVPELRCSDNEASEVKWIPLNSVHKYKWAFHHLEMLRKAGDLLSYENKQC